jgi:hypothetical protein
LDILAKYQETLLSTLESFYFLKTLKTTVKLWWIGLQISANILKAETAKVIQDKEKESEIQKDWLLSDFLTYEQRLKNIYYSIVKFESWLKTKIQAGTSYT